MFSGENAKKGFSKNLCVFHFKNAKKKRKLKCLVDLIIKNKNFLNCRIIVRATWVYGVYWKNLLYIWLDCKNLVSSS